MKLSIILFLFSFAIAPPSKTYPYDVKIVATSDSPVAFRKNVDGKWYSTGIPWQVNWTLLGKIGACTNQKGANDCSINTNNFAMTSNYDLSWTDSSVYTKSHYYNGQTFNGYFYLMLSTCGGSITLRFNFDKNEALGRLPDYDKNIYYSTYTPTWDIPLNMICSKNR